MISAHVALFISTERFVFVWTHLASWRMVCGNEPAEAFF